MEILNEIWNRWKRFAQFLGDWIARIILTIFYFSFFLPFGLIISRWGDPLAIRNSQPRWITRITHDVDIDKARRMF